uniref:Nuclear transcription factor Y subunit n=1 Tax=Meloidogyne javanica TaxID=6303 RepID=A0A915NC71_MELJA
MSAQKPINCQNGQINFVEMTKNIPSPQEEYLRSSPSSFVQNGQNIQKTNKQQTIIEQDSQPQRQYYQLVQIPAESAQMLGVDPSSFIGNEKSLQQPQQHYVLQLPQGIQLANNQSGEGILNTSNNSNDQHFTFSPGQQAMMPFQVMSLGDGSTALIPLGTSITGGQKYLHESRHRHAQNRARKEGGKFDSGGQQRAGSSASAASSSAQ